MRSTPVTAPNGKRVEYHPLTPGEMEGSCYLCGAESTGKPKAKVIKDTFTDHSWAKAPYSEMVCDYCAWALSYKFDTRAYTLFATLDGLRLLSRAEIRGLLLKPPPATPYLLCVAVSGQKWLHFKGQVGVSSDEWVLMMEERKMRVIPGQFAAVLDPVERLYRVFTKDEIASGDYQAHRILEYGMGAWERDEALIARHRGSRLIDLALFVAQKPEEAK
jgi:CRISPR type IV-associated protein Csf1